MPDKDITVQFRSGSLQGETYQAIWEEEWTIEEVVNDAAVALGAIGATEPDVTTRNCTVDEEERTLNHDMNIMDERATKWSITVTDYTEEEFERGPF